MAPLASEPRQVLAVLNPARRKALYTLLVEITAFMRSQLDFHEPTASSSAEAPLLIDPLAENSIIVPAPAEAPSRPSPALVRLRAAAIEHFDAWRKDVLGKLKELLSTPDEPRIVDERRKRAERVAQQQQQQQHDNNHPEYNGEARNEGRRAQAVALLQAHWHPIPTRLVTIPYEDRREALSCVLLVLLSTGKYSAESRALAVYLTSALELPLDVLNAEETEIARSLVERSTGAAQQQQRGMSAEAEAEKRRRQNQSSRFLKVGLASVAGAALIGVTGGLAAPVVAGAIGGLMGSVGLGGVASFLGIFWMNGALVGTLFGAFGARMTVSLPTPQPVPASELIRHGQGEMVDRYAREVEDFRFIPLKDEWATRGEAHHDRRLRVTIGVNGWLDSKEDVTKPWRSLGDDSESFALRYEMKSLLGLGKSLKELVSSYAWNYVKVEILKRTVLATLWSALWPAHLLSMASAIDNPFSLAKNRSEKAGEILADALINKVQGERPVTLIGFSLGARVIYSCLRSLAARRAFGLVDTVVFIGAPAPSNKQHWQMMRTVVSGKMYNVYSENDYLLAFLYRATSIQLGVAGLQEIKGIDGVVNLNLSDEVQGHMRYPKIISQVLARCGIPVVPGADGPIERDDDTIKLDDLDKDNKEMANLIDLDCLGITEHHGHGQRPHPPVSTASSAAQSGNQPRVAGFKLSEASSSPTPSSAGNLAASSPPRRRDPAGREPSSPKPVPAVHPKTQQPTMSNETGKSAPPVDGAPGHMAASPPVSSASAPTSHSPRPNRPPSPVLASSHDRGGPVYEDEEEDEDEDEGGRWRIKMVDNDQGDLTYVDPTPIKD